MLLLQMRYCNVVTHYQEKVDIVLTCVTIVRVLIHWFQLLLAIIRRCYVTSISAITVSYSANIVFVIHCFGAFFVCSCSPTNYLFGTFQYVFARTVLLIVV